MNCEFCNTLLDEQSHQVRFCSRECARDSIRGSFYICKHCGNAYHRKNRAGDEGKTYCSRECAFADKRDPSHGTEHICPECGKAFTTSEREGRRYFCSDRCSGLNEYRRTLPSEYICKHCGQSFAHRGNHESNVYCSDDCRDKAQRITRHQRGYARRAQIQSTAEEIDIYEVAERDGWLCGLCGELITTDKSWPDPEAMSLDHIVPISRGGEHTMTNVQVAHLICNWKKQNKIGVGARLTLT